MKERGKVIMKDAFFSGHGVRLLNPQGMVIFMCRYANCFVKR